MPSKNLIKNIKKNDVAEKKLKNYIKITDGII
jgi:hypothetical protein